MTIIRFDGTQIYCDWIEFTMDGNLLADGNMIIPLSEILRIIPTL